MRKLLALLAAVTLLGLGAGFAQNDAATTTVRLDDRVTENYWAGFSVGYPGIYGHFGLKDVIGRGGDIRANLGFSYLGGGVVFGADALFDINLDVDAPLGLYLGGGPLVSVGGGGAGFGIEGIAGLEYRLIEAGLDSGSIFFELGPVIGFPGGFGFLGRFGFNYYF
jgi:hypothetical protein